MEKTLLKVAAGINLVLGGIIFLISSFVFFAFGSWGVIAIPFFAIAAYQFLLGGLFLGGADNIDKNINTARVLAIIASVLSILTGHMISFILGIIAFTNILQKNESPTQPEPEKTDEEKAERRLRILLALGCGLVILAGIIFAMTTWETLSGFGKTFALIIASVIFFIMSFLAENKFNIKRSSITYYILGNVFAVFAFVAAGYFNIFGEWFSLNGGGTHLYQAFLWGIGGVLALLAYFKYEANDIFYIFDLCVLMLILSLVKFADLGNDVWVFVAVAILSLFALVKGENGLAKTTNKFALIFLPVASIILLDLVALLTKSDRLVFYLLAFACAFIASYYNAIKNKNLFYEIFAPIFTLVTAFVLAAVIGADSKIILLQFLVISLVVYAIGYARKEQKGLFSTTNGVVDLGLLYIVLDALNLNFNYFAIVGAVMLLSVSIVASLKGNVGKFYFENLLEPLKVILLSYTIYKLFYTFDYREETLFLALVGMIFAVICLFRKETMKTLYFIGGILVTVLAMPSSVRYFAPVSQFLGVLSLLILLAITFSRKDERYKGNRELVYGLEILALALFVLNTFIHFDLKVIGVIVLTFIYVILFIMSNRNSIFRSFTVVALLIPYVIILPISIWNANVNYILYSLPWIALIFIYTRGFLSSIDNKKVNWIEGALLCIWYIQVGSRICLEVALFIGIISFVSILVGYKSDKWLSLYVTGIIFMILNIIVQLKEFWETLPIWVYILLAGLVLIGIVTYSEYKKANKKLDAQKVEPEIVSAPQSTDIWRPIDRRAIVTGTILYIVIIPILLEIIGR